MGKDVNNSYKNAPVKEAELKENSSYTEIIVAKRDDYLTATLKNKLPVCIDNEFEKSWIEFHRTNAILRVLCKKCNLYFLKDQIKPNKPKINKGCITNMPW